MSSAVINSWTAVCLQVSWDSGQTWETFVSVKQADSQKSLWYRKGSVYHVIMSCDMIKIIDIRSIQTIQLHHIPHKLYDISPLQAILTHWGPDEMKNISSATFSNVFSSMKMFEFLLKFHWSLFPRVQLTIFQHWFRWWIGAVQATSHYLHQWWLVYRRIYASLGLNELTAFWWSPIPQPPS